MLSSPHTVAVLSGLFRHYHGQRISQSEQGNTNIEPIGECLESGTHQVSGVTNCLSSEYSTGWSTRPGSDNWTRQMRAAHTRPGQSLRPLRSYQISIIDKHSIPIQSIIRAYIQQNRILNQKWSLLMKLKEKRYSLKCLFNCVSWTPKLTLNISGLSVKLSVTIIKLSESSVNMYYVMWWQHCQSWGKEEEDSPLQCLMNIVWLWIVLQRWHLGRPNHFNLVLSFLAPVMLPNQNFGTKSV